MVKKTIDEILDKIDFKLKPLVLRGTKFADEIVITGKKKAKSALLDFFVKEMEGVIVKKDGEANMLNTHTAQRYGYNQAVDQFNKAIQKWREEQ